MRLASLYRLNEDSRGNIVRLLGMSPAWARYFHEKAGKYAFAMANWVRASAKIGGVERMLRSDPSQLPEPQLPAAMTYDRERLEATLAQMPREDALITSMLLSAGHGGETPHPWQPFASISLLEASPRLLKLLSSPKFDASQLKLAVNDAQADLDARQDVSSLGKTVMEFPDGFEWKSVTDDEFHSFGGPLRNCGESCGQMFVLMKGGKTYAAAALDERGLDQIVGIGNQAPKPRYRQYVHALAQKLGTGIARGEKSWGANYG